MVRESRGYTLVELLLAIFIFSVVMGLISVSFNRIVSSSGQVIKSAESNIGGLIGLEVMRLDLGNAGLGLPWSIGTATYSECTESHTIDAIPETNATRFNDSKDNPTNDDGKDHPPRAFVLLDNKGYNGSDYLVIKGSAVGYSRSSRRWSYLSFGNGSSAIAKPSKSDTELVSGKMDRAIIVNSGVRVKMPFRELVTNGSSFTVTYEQAEALPRPFRPKEVNDRYLVYGLAPPRDNSDPDDVITFPFNRVDYYLAPSDTSASACSHRNSRGANKMAMLYRAQVTQRGKFQRPATAILDCVADLQVIFMLNTSNDGQLVPTPLEQYIEGFLDSDPEVPPRKMQKDVPEELRRLVREVRVYVLVQ